MSRAISSASSVRETPVSENRPGRELDPGQAELAAGPRRPPPGSWPSRGRAARRRSGCPGVTTRTTSRLTSPLASFGSSTCSQTAARWPGLDELGQVGLQRRVGEPGHRDGVRPLVAGRQGQAEQGARRARRPRRTSRRSRPSGTAAAHRDRGPSARDTAASSGSRTGRSWNAIAETEDGTASRDGTERSRRATPRVESVRCGASRRTVERGSASGRLRTCRGRPAPRRRSRRPGRAG